MQSFVMPNKGERILESIFEISTTFTTTINTM